MSNAGSVIVIVVSVVSALVVLGVAVTIGIYIWKRRYIQKKRRGNKAFVVCFCTMTSA